MKIAIDARWIFERITGIGTYTREIIRQFARIASDHNFVLFFNNPYIAARERAECGLDKSTNVGIITVPYGVYSVKSQIMMPRVIGRQHPAIYHSTNVMIPFAAFRGRHGRPRCVVTVHDLVPLAVPHLLRRSKKGRLLFIYRLVVGRIITLADVIVTDSEASRRDILRFYPSTDPSKIRVIHCGVSNRFLNAATRRVAASKTPPTGGQTDRPIAILYVGRSDPYKNVEGAVRILHRLKQMSRLPVKLIIAGPEDPRFQEARTTAARLGIANDIMWTGYLPDDKLLDMYKQASVLIHPSLYEGFGLQILEAMACGLPVVCSNISSLPEVAGDAAILEDPSDEAAFAKQVADVLVNPTLYMRLSRAGIKRASLFTWENTARKLLAVYEELME